MTTPEVIRNNEHAELVMLSIPSKTPESRAQAQFVFGAPEEQPDTAVHTNVGERLTWIGGCLTRYAALDYLGSIYMAQQGLEQAYGDDPVLRPSLSESAIKRLFNLTGTEDKDAAIVSPTSDVAHRLRNSNFARTGQIIGIVGQKLQTLIDMPETNHVAAHGASSDFLHFFIRKPQPAPADTMTGLEPDNIALTISSVSRPDREPLYRTELDITGPRRDARAKFEYSFKTPESPDHATQLTVNGNITYGPNDYQHQNVMYASLGVAGMHVREMGV